MKYWLLLPLLLIAMRPLPGDVWQSEPPQSPNYIVTYLTQFEYKRTGYTCLAMRPEQLAEIGYGVCRDFAYTSMVMLREMNYDARILQYHVKHEKRGNVWVDVWHAITIFQWRGEWWIFSNQYKVGPFEGVDEIIATYAHAEYEWVEGRNFCAVSE